MTISHTSAEILKVGFRNYPPLMIQGSEVGIYADILKKITVIGNDRITDDTIILFSNVSLNHYKDYKTRIFPLNYKQNLS